MVFVGYGEPGSELRLWGTANRAQNSRNDTAVAPKKSRVNVTAS
jgi:hypothetical protein